MKSSGKEKKISLSSFIFMKCQNTRDKEKTPKGLRKEIQVNWEDQEKIRKTPDFSAATLEAGR